MSLPRVSVVMGVRNGQPWISEAVGSILGQTASDLELVVVDDGSTDQTVPFLEGIGDPRLLVVRQAPAGLTSALNRGLRMARAPLIARMDADDLAHPDRLSRQVAFFRAHPEVGLLGTGCQEISGSGEILRTIVPPQDDGAIRRVLIRRNPFVHSSVAFRRTVLDATGPYDQTFSVAQDYDLWMRMSRVTRMANLSDPLVLRRLTPGRVSLSRDSQRLRAELAVRARAISNGLYPGWCRVFLLRPALALLLPPGARRLVREALRRLKIRRTASRPGI
jgi:glycosyltransferase involved in cell wall biosynthesis